MTTTRHPLAREPYEQLSAHSDMYDIDEAGIDGSCSSNGGNIDRNNHVPCSCCQNIATIFAIMAEKKTVRQPWRTSKNAIAHHINFNHLLDSSETCALCALIIACFAESPARGRIENALEVEEIREEEAQKPGKTRRNKHKTGQEYGLLEYFADREKEVSASPVFCSVEEVSGSGGLISHLAMTVFVHQQKIDHILLGTNQYTEDYVRLADGLLRTYSEPGMSFCSIKL